MPVILETERLRLRTFTIADASFVLQLLNTPNWLKYIGDRGIKTIEQTQSYLANGPIMSYTTYGFGLYLVELKATGIPIGMCGLLKRNYLEHMDIGYALLPAYEGNGYACEIAAATMNYAFTKLHLMHLAAITDTGNERSVKLLEKLGFQLQELIVIENKDLNLFIRDAQT
ncbi:GNAT family N-acetyltransferase [Mucilaginibacter galii]|uniref:Alanine acetyltransferase n=1 Tax=Mucilaginibacter galii TaxID=2005073 RepID=A0A917JEP2_9SPHI|nr:GNAT family N-acetyltransferase [Mucilaginibacter galii]GGI52349.1 alanine acetyltransferase [Mucilaginibacter galii]